jgi:dienelactone hydrolase
VPLYDGTCPQFTDGLNEDFLSSGNNRQFRLALPDNPDGAPVIFAWHWLGGSAQQAMDWLEFGELPQSENVIVVAPESDGYPSEWRFDQESDNNPDATLFEDILACLVEQWDVDLGRVHTTGMSAGGLWSTWMILNRSEWLASAAPMSGGVLSNYYTSPTDPIPVMLIWGGPTDVYGSFSFDLASKDFSEDLQGDGHFVVECDHGSGHVPPDSPATLAWDFFSEHPKAEDSPWEAGLPTHLPSFCSLP